MQGIKVPKRQAYIALSVLVRPWRAATGHQRCLLTGRLLLLIAGMGRAKGKESFRLEEERGDADGEGGPPGGLRLLPS